MEELLAATPQPTPRPGKVAVADYVLADIQARVEAGQKKYGTKLMTNNGRSADWDLYQELIDAVMYQRQKLLEVETRPKIVCLCGSTRFYKEFQEAYFELTLKGFIVLSVGFFGHSSAQAHGETIGITPEQKKELDELHLRKIDMADMVFVINVGGYIGKSTDNEIRYAIRQGKEVSFLKDLSADGHLKYWPDQLPLVLKYIPSEYAPYAPIIKHYKELWQLWEEQHGQ